MINNSFSKSDPLQTIQRLIKERYKAAKAVFWAGSVSQNQGTDSSDLDLVIVFESLPHAYREAFIYDGWPIDSFVHDLNTLQYFFEDSRTGNGISGLNYMILNGQLITLSDAHILSCKKPALILKLKFLQPAQHNDGSRRAFTRIAIPSA